MDYTAAEILPQMQEIKPTRFKNRSRRKVSSIFCFAFCFLPGHVRCVPGSKAYLLASCISFCVQSKNIQCNTLLQRQGLRS